MEYVAQTYLMSKTRRTHMLIKRFLSDKEAFLSIRDTNSVVLNMNLIAKRDSKECNKYVHQTYQPQTLNDIPGSSEILHDSDGSFTFSVRSGST